jgi:hypothetical protein
MAALSGSLSTWRTVQLRSAGVSASFTAPHTWRPPVLPFPLRKALDRVYAQLDLLI